MTEKELEQLQNKMIELEQIIDSWEEYYLAKLGPLQVRLRHKVMFIHQLIEQELDFLLIDWAINSINTKVGVVREAHVMYRINQLIDGLDFAKKLNLARDLGLLDKVPKAFSKLMDVNQLRVYFSHPKSHKKQLEPYKTAVAYVRALEVLINGHQAIGLLRGYDPIGWKSNT